LYRLWTPPKTHGARRRPAGHGAEAAATIELQEREDELLTAGAIEGKNAELRAAQLREATRSVREVLEEREEVVARLKIGLHHLQAEHSSLRAIARLMAAGSE
jgi:hypothetical protein